MALTIKMLQAMNLEDAQIDQIIEAHRDTINGLTEERDTLKEDLAKAKAEADRLANVEKDLVKAQAKVEEAEQTAEELKNLKTEFETYKTDISQKETKAQKEKAYRELLTEAGISEKRFDSILKISGANIDALEFDDDGKVKDSKNLVEGIKSEWADFVQTKITEGAKPATPPQGAESTDYDKLSDADYYKLTYEQKKKGQ